MAHEMDLRLLRAFVAVAEKGGFSAAAAALHLTQPALSRRIRDLEMQLGVPLFDRTSRRVRLTSSGEALLARSRALLADADALKASASSLEGGRGGILRLGSAPLLMTSLVVPFLAHYHRHCPEVEVQLHERGGVRLLESVLEGDLHLAVVSPVEPRLASRPLFPWRVLAVVVKGHPLARRRTVELETLAGEPMLTPLTEFTVRRAFDAACETLRLQPRIRMESGTPQTLVAMARAGYGVAIVPSSFEVEKRGVSVLPLLARGESIGRWTAVNWDASRHQPAYAKRFVDILLEFTRRNYPGRQYGFAPPIDRAESSLT